MPEVVQENLIKRINRVLFRDKLVVSKSKANKDRYGDFYLADLQDGFVGTHHIDLTAFARHMEVLKPDEVIIVPKRSHQKRTPVLNVPNET